ncbi:MAG: glucose-1-phosphate cytidylyltransferase [Actinobacteria bacterium]|nr:glucose-1-phosphate cytidylyltransferase [Actinomycetota bacterium]
MEPASPEPTSPEVVILCGGRGTRLREETEYRPKPMVEVGGHPVLWHLMKLFAHHGCTQFVCCTGYRGEMIKDYFLNYEARNSDVTVTLGDHASARFHGSHLETGWEVTVADTGAETQTGGRVKRVERYLRGDRFIVTYGDGLADVDLGALLAFHAEHGKLATVTTTRPLSRFGIVDLEPDQTVRRFREKPQGDEWVSSGFFVFERAFLEYLDDDCVLERAPLERLASEGEIVAYRHDGFWQPMDTYREFLMLNELWDSGKAPWAVWESGSGR